MRLRASIENVPTFFRIIQTMEKLQKKCIVKFTEDNMQIICNDRANEGGLQVWSQIKVSSLFTGYRIQSNAGNEITMLLSSEALLAALKSAMSSSTLSLGGNTSATANVSGDLNQGAKRTREGGGTGMGHDFDEIVMKLAKKNDQAVMSFEIFGTTRTGKRVRVGHDVKIEILRPSDVDRLREPMCPEPDTHVLLPPLPGIRTVVDRLRPMSEVLAVSASLSGTVKLSIHTEAVKVDTEWKDCVNPKMSRDPSGSQSDEDGTRKDPNQMFTVLVSLKSFLKFLNSHVVSTTTIACICHQHCLILYVYIGDVADAGGVLTFYVPGIVEDD